MSVSNDPPAPPFFELRDLRFSYSAAGEAVRGVSFQIRRGEMVGIIGPNGAGKSTLLGLMIGLLDPSGGEVLIEGAPLAALSPMQRALRIGFVPQTPRVFFPYSVAEIVAMGRHPFVSPFGGLSKRDLERVHWAMDVTGVGPFAGRSFNQLSGGEAQRVVLARALAQDAPALLLDEPTSSLDLYYQTVLYGLLERMNRDHGLTVVTVTHDINLAAEYCPRMIGVREGRVAMDGAPEDILTSEKIRELYGVQAEIVTGGDGRLVRVRHFGPENSEATRLAPSDPSPAPRPGAN